MVQPSFKKMHDQWLQMHIDQRVGERKRRLQAGHGHAEKAALQHIWWPAFRSFEWLHPEYEVTDFQGGRRFLDLAYIRSGIRIDIEIDGYGPHWKNISRRQFCDHRVRQMHLINDGWIVVQIGYDDIVERPRLWQQLLLQMIGRYFGDANMPMKKLDFEEIELLRLARRLNRPIRIEDVRNRFQCGYRAARGILERLVEKKWIVPASGGSMRVHSWQICAETSDLPL